MILQPTKKTRAGKEVATVDFWAVQGHKEVHLRKLRDIKIVAKQAVHSPRGQIEAF